jgi:hypothetical protein
MRHLHEEELQLLREAFKPKTESIGEQLLDRYVDWRTADIIEYLKKNLRKIITNYVTAAANRYRQLFNIQPIINLQFSAAGDVDTLVVECALPPGIYEKVRRLLEAKMRGANMMGRIRIKALYELIRGELESATGELGAVLSAGPEPAPEGLHKAGGGREEVRDQEGGCSYEGADQGAVRGVPVEGEEE